MSANATRKILQNLDTHLDDSMGVRKHELKPKLSPVPNTKDVGRKPNRNFGSVEVNQVIPAPEQPRREFETTALQQLALSLKEQGQLTPIRARWSPDNNKWMIIAGERRWRACKLAGLEWIDCYFEDDNLTLSKIREHQLIENCLREDLKPIEQAEAFASLMELNHWTGKELASQLHLNPTAVSRALALLKLPESVQAQVTSGELSARTAYEITKLKNRNAQQEIAEQTTIEKLTHKQTLKAINSYSTTRRRKQPKPPTRLTFQTETGWTLTAKATKPLNYHTLENALTEALEEVQTRIKNNVNL